MDKEILVQYCDMKEEIKDIRRRIRELDKYLENPPIVADVVKGTRKNGTLGPIKVTGIPDPQFKKKKVAVPCNRYYMVNARREWMWIFKGKVHWLTTDTAHALSCEYLLLIPFKRPAVGSVFIRAVPQELHLLSCIKKAPINR